MLKLTFVFVFVLSVANCQFFYNYEEERSEDPGTQNYDPSEFQYNPPSTVNQQFVQAPRNEPSTETGNRRTHIRVRSRNYNSDQEYNEPQQAENDPASEPSPEQRAVRQQRRQARRRQRQMDYVEPTLPPRVYSPSIFENIGLGEAPSGVYIPQDSFLNVLRNPSRRTQTLTSNPVSYPLATVPQTTNYVQPSVSYVNSAPQQRFFVQPPLNDEPRPTNVILPVTRPQVEYSAPSPVNANQVTGSQTVQARAVGSNRRARPRVRPQREYAAPPTVDIDSLREYTDDVARENVMSQMQYVQPKPRTQSRRRKVTSYRETTLAPRVYSPSVFEKVGLGEAPSGIYIPEDSLLNSLRNPSEHSMAHRPSRQLPPEQPTFVPEEYVGEVIEEEPYQPPPPPRSPSRRRSSQRSRQAQASRRSQHQGYQSEQPDQTAVQSSNQPRSDEYEDFQRQRPTAQQRAQPQRRQQLVSATAPKLQTQPSSSSRGQSTFRKAKLAIAALPLDTDDDGIPGEAGVNYPTLHVIPKTAFSCAQQEHNGYYADLETSCQVVHLCQSGGVKSSFLCPNGTIFSQEKFSCQWWYKVNCSDAPKFYIKNDELYKVPEKTERKRN